MLEKSRLKSKKISKTGSVQSQLDVPLSADDIHIGRQIMFLGKKIIRLLSYE